MLAPEVITKIRQFNDALMDVDHINLSSPYLSVEGVFMHRDGELVSFFIDGEEYDLDIVHPLSIYFAEYALAEDPEWDGFDEEVLVENPDL